MTIPEHIIDDAVDAILAARDFCGDERAASSEVCVDHGLFSREARARVHRIATHRANRIWDGFRAAAGVQETPSL